LNSVKKELNQKKTFNQLMLNF